MSARVDGNRIVIPIEIAMEDKQEWRQMREEIREAAEEQKTIEPRYEKLDFAQEEYNQDPDFYDALQKSIMDDVEEAIDKAEEAKAPVNLPEGKDALSVLSRVGQSPEASLLQLLTLVAPQLGPLLIASGAAKVIFDWYFSPGAPGDLRNRIKLAITDLMTQQQKQQRRIGQTQVIITSTDGFRSLNGANSGNTFAQVRNSGTANVGLYDKASGWRP